MDGIYGSFSALTFYGTGLAYDRVTAPKLPNTYIRDRLAAVEVMNRSEGCDGNSNALRYGNDGTWISNEGLIYGQGSIDGNRVNHILQHTQLNPYKPIHTVFNVDRCNVIGLVDEAWINRGNGILQSNGNVYYDIDLGRTVGINGETTIRIITRGYSDNIITAYPK